MQIVRVYSGNDGESHFEDLTSDQFAEIVNRVGPGDITINRRSSPSFSDYHTAPRRQYVINMAGTAEFETADGAVRRLVPGDVLGGRGPDRTRPHRPQRRRRVPGIPWPSPWPTRKRFREATKWKTKSSSSGFGKRLSG